ncbi:hypothetical protein D5085_01135 [Ectothiorhodospiraceae bacterium BW-2]|nr:hypothetical protein D5085_01135 [Ectothiorhodospiraceae bacterium BW-2]
MFKEICITPQVFDAARLQEEARWKDIKILLDSLAQSGYIVGLNNKEWAKRVMTRVNTLPASIRERLLGTIAILRDRDRIVGHPKLTTISYGENESDWFSIALTLHQLRPFYKIIANDTYQPDVMALSQLDSINISEVFGLTGSHHCIKSQENLHEILLPFLSYAKKLTIIDPYFYLELPRYQTSLRVMANNFRERRGLREGGRIIIHCKWEEKKSHLVSRWQQFLNKMGYETAHQIELYAWERKEDELKLHERYIITNQGGLVSGAGTDKDDFQQSEWSIKDYRELGDILPQYRSNSSPFQLRVRVDAESVEMFN